MAQPGFGYPPPVESNPPQGTYPPTQGGYPPTQGGYPPVQGGYQPPQAGYPQLQGGHPSPVQPGYAPAQPGYAPPVSQQPGYAAPASAGYGQMQWMPPPPVPANCPPGLEYLTQIDQLLIKQQVELLEAFTGFETNNKYKILNSMGQQVYFATEDTDCCTRQCCGPGRPFEMKILNNQQQEIVHLTRPLRCQSCLFPCCLQEIEVQSPPGTVLGYCAQEWSICIPKFAIQNADRETVLRIEGPFCQCNLCGDVEFQVLSADGQNQVGRISKQWSGLVKEAFTDADNFGITFPMDLDVKMKAVVLGACFLIDFMFFEKAQNQDNHNY